MTRKSKKPAKPRGHESYEQRIAALRAGYLERETKRVSQEQQTNRKSSWQSIRKSIPRLIAGVPTRSHGELMEMFRKCAKKMAGRKPAEISPAVLSLHAAILEEWQRRASSLLADDGYFKWPTTEAPPGDGSVSGSTWRAIGMLSEMGYHVGTTEGLPYVERRFILDQVHDICLPPLNDRFYMLEWGEPRTPGRLRKTAETIAALARNAKRRRLDLQAACDDWEGDLDYLYTKYYVGRYRFAWPKT